MLTNSSWDAFSPAQYELQFTKWEARKNLNANEWRQIFRVLDQYDRDGINYVVLKDQEPISAAKLKKKRKLYCEGHDYVRVCQTGGKFSRLACAGHLEMMYNV